MGLIIKSLGADTLELDIQGVLKDEDYEQFVPRVETRIEEHGKVNLLVRISHLRGWMPHALWEDLKFDVKHYNDVGRLALVGDSTSDKWMAKLSKPFTGAEVKYFEQGDIEAARQWATGAAAS